MTLSPSCEKTQKQFVIIKITTKGTKDREDTKEKNQIKHNLQTSLTLRLPQ
jgi:hypothetical protein